MKMKIIWLFCLLILVGCNQDPQIDAILDTGMKLEAIDGGQTIKREKDIYIYQTKIDDNTVTVSIDPHGITSEYMLVDDTLQVNFTFDACTNMIEIHSVIVDDVLRDDLNEQLSGFLLSYLEPRISRDARVIIDDYCQLVRG